MANPTAYMAAGGVWKGGDPFVTLSYTNKPFWAARL